MSEGTLTLVAVLVVFIIFAVVLATSLLPMLASVGEGLWR